MTPNFFSGNSLGRGGDDRCRQQLVHPNSSSTIGRTDLRKKKLWVITKKTLTLLYDESKSTVLGRYGESIAAINVSRRGEAIHAVISADWLHGWGERIANSQKQFPLTFLSLPIKRHFSATRAPPSHSTSPIRVSQAVAHSRTPPTPPHS